ncbi:MAG: bifunctional folylpolyglutamate synthase/dihydrofolate synthase [Flavobacteriaceae bacterium]|nr:bifunctional folylpolyglutamate synthase/dihydrofolate synthase [Flavobacteriaceae bacterium]
MKNLGIRKQFNPFLSELKSYKETLDWMFNQLPYYQNRGHSAYRPGLQRVEKLVAYLGNPQNTIKAIHIAGTNGKGSTAHMIASVFMESGYKVGLFISPHFLDYRERITLNGKKIPKTYVQKFIEKHYAFLTQWQISFFEMNIGLALDYFKVKQVDYAVLEVGLGGRLDATNIVKPILSIITNIGLDHTEFLGNTIEKIAFEKAGIIKPNIPVLIGQKQNETHRVFKSVSQSKNAPLFYPTNNKGIERIYKNWPKYQYKNIQTAIGALKLIQQNEKIRLNIAKGIQNTIKNTRFLGRWQIVAQYPLVVMDVAHNMEGFREIIKQLDFYSYKTLRLVMGFVKGRSHQELFEILPKNSIWYLSSPKVERAKSKPELMVDIPQNPIPSHQFYKTIKQAFEKAHSEAHPRDMVLVCGSTFVVAEVLGKLYGDQTDRRKF